LIERAAVDLHVHGLNGVLTQLGMTEGPAGAGPGGAGPGGTGTGGTGTGGTGTGAEPTKLNRFIWLRCASAGWWEPAVQPGECVAKGQLLGTVSTIDGAEVLQIIEAPTDG